MMRPCRVIAATLAVLIAACPSSAAAITADALIRSTTRDDGRRVTLEGEALGETLRAQPGHRWVNVLDGQTAIGVVVTDDMAARVTRFGDWGTTGDRVRVSGTFNLACDDHGGDLDIHADSLSVVTPGERRDHPVLAWKAVVIGLGAPAAAILANAYRRRRRRLDP